MRKVNNIWDEYEKYETIGSGGFAKVYRAKILKQKNMLQ